jgi:hypothetical protein
MPWRADLQLLYHPLQEPLGNTPIFSILQILIILPIIRDIVEVRMDLGGISCIVRDTAGLRKDTTDEIELEGIQRAR